MRIFHGGLPMKNFLLLIIVFLFNTAFAGMAYQGARLISRGEINSLHSSVDRTLLEKMKRETKGEDSDSLYLVNACSKEIIAFAKYYDISGEWTESNFWQLSENQYAYIGETQNEYYYAGGISLDETLVWGDRPIVFRGQDVFVSEMRITSSDWGDWLHTYSCDEK